MSAGAAPIGRHPNPVEITINPKACDACHSKKVRCDFDPAKGVCTGCLHRNIPCLTTPRQRKPRQDLAKNKERLRYLEDRLRRIDAILNAAGILTDEEAERTHHDAEHHDTESDHEVDVDDADGSSTKDDDGHGSEEESGGTTLDPQSQVRRLPEASALPSSTLAARENQDESNTIPPASVYSLLNDGKTTATAENRPGDSSLPTQDQKKNAFSGSHPSSTPAFGSNMLPHISSQPPGARPGTFHISSEDIQQIMNPKPGKGYLEALSSILDGPPTFSNRHDLFGAPDPYILSQLPSRNEAYQLFDQYFQTANTFIPLHDKPIFMRMVDGVYGGKLNPDTAVLANINLVLAITYARRASSAEKPFEKEEKAWHYFSAATSAISQLMLEPPSLLSIQALLGIGMFLLLSGAAGSGPPLVTAALRAAYQMGLHETPKNSDIPEDQLRQRRRIFWIACFMDHRLSLRAGVPPMQYFDDMDQSLKDDLPWLEPWPPANNPDHHGSLFFHSVGQLTIISSRAIQRLYSRKGLASDSEEVSATVKELNDELREWRKGIDLDVDPYRELANPNDLTNFTRISMQLIYYHTIMVVNRAPLFQALRKFEKRKKIQAFIESQDFNDSPEIAEKATSDAAKACVDAALASLKLIQDIPKRDIFGIWGVTYYVFRAASMIFTEIIHDSRHSSGQEDIMALSMARAFFSALDARTGHTRAVGSFLCKLSAGFERIALDITKSKELGRDTSAMEKEGKALLPRAFHFPPSDAAGEPIPMCPSEQAISTGSGSSHPISPAHPVQHSAALPPGHKPSLYPGIPSYHVNERPLHDSTSGAISSAASSSPNRPALIFAQTNQDPPRDWHNSYLTGSLEEALSSVYPPGVGGWDEPSRAFLGQQVWDMSAPLWQMETHQVPEAMWGIWTTALDQATSHERTSDEAGEGSRRLA